MNLLHSVHWLHRGPATLPRDVLHVVVACALLTIGANAAEESTSNLKPDVEQWKAILGDWYEYKDSTGRRWDARDIATFQGKVAATFLLRRADEETTEHRRAVLFADGKKVLPLPYNVGGKLRIEV